MANINDNIRSKKLYKSGDTTRAYKDSSGEIVVPSKVATEIAAVSDITELLNDHDNYSKSIYLLKEIENMRQDIEELHAFIKDAFGKDSTSAASKGDKGDSGNTGPQGPQGPQGPARRLKVIQEQQGQQDHKDQLALKVLLEQQEQRGLMVETGLMEIVI